jgi:glucokinase
VSNFVSFKIKSIEMKQNKILAVDLGGTNIRVGVVENGTISEKYQEKLQNKDDLELSLAQFKSVLSKLMNPEIEAIGIGVPSVVDVEQGIVYNVANIPSWVEVPLKEILETTFHVPVRINNDVNCFVLGEAHVGAAQGHASVVGLTVGTGLGAGLYFGNNLYGGHNTGAGEIGLLPYLDRDLEFYCSSSFFAEIHHTSGEILFEKAELGDADALAVWAEYGKHMAQAIKYVVLAYDPQTIVIGGSIAKANRFFRASMLENLSDFAFPKSMERLKIRFSNHPDSQLIGASLLF